jgi:hypothetical protein
MESYDFSANLWQDRRCSEIEYVGHKLIDNLYYSIRGNIIALDNIASLEPEYHNNNRSLYIKVLKKTGGKNIIKLKSRDEYNYIVDIINSILDTKYKKI